MKYEKAMAEVVVLDNSDVITTSCGDKNGGNGQNNGNGGGPKCDNPPSKTTRTVEAFWLPEDLA